MSETDKENKIDSIHKSSGLNKKIATVISMVVVGVVVGFSVGSLINSNKEVKEPQLIIPSEHVSNNNSNYEMVRSVLLSHPEIIVEAGKAYREKMEKEEVEKIKESYKLVDANIKDITNINGGYLGNPSGKKIVVEFFDYQCHFCRASEAGIKELLSKDKDIILIEKEVPFINQDSVFLERLSIAAAKLGEYEAVHNLLMSIPLPYTNDSLKKAFVDAKLDFDKIKQRSAEGDVTKILDDNLALVKKLGINGTPSFVIPGTPIHQGFPGVEVLEKEISGEK